MCGARAWPGPAPSPLSPPWTCGRHRHPRLCDGGWWRRPSRTAMRCPRPLRPAHSPSQPLPGRGVSHLLVSLPSRRPLPGCPPGPSRLQRHTGQGAAVPTRGHPSHEGGWGQQGRSASAARASSPSVRRPSDHSCQQGWEGGLVCPASGDSVSGRPRGRGCAVPPSAGQSLVLSAAGQLTPSLAVSPLKHLGRPVGRD